jgi:hypothetical protein
MLESNSIRGDRYAGSGFAQAVSRVLSERAELARATLDQSPGTAALHSTAAYVQSLPTSDPHLYVLYMAGGIGNENGSWTPAPGAESVIAAVAGQYLDSPDAKDVLAELAIATLEDSIVASVQAAQDARQQIAVAQADADQARAQLVETAPLLDRVAELEQENAAKATELDEAAEKIKFLKSGYADWVKATTPKGARKAVAA